jgi:hypothetical protein
MGTHDLESTDIGASEDTKRMPVSEGHSRPGEHRGRDK